MAILKVLEVNETYQALCADEKKPSYKFTFDGDEAKLVELLREIFSEEPQRDVALDCGGHWFDEDSQGGELFGHLSLWDDKSQKWREPAMQCWEDSFGYNTIIISGPIAPERFGGIELIG